MGICEQGRMRINKEEGKRAKVPGTFWNGLIYSKVKSKCRGKMSSHLYPTTTRSNASSCAILFCFIYGQASPVASSMTFLRSKSWVWCFYRIINFVLTCGHSSYPKPWQVAFVCKGWDERTILWEQQPQSTRRRQGSVMTYLFIKDEFWTPNFHFVVLKDENMKLAIKHKVKLTSSKWANSKNTLKNIIAIKKSYFPP